MCHYDIIGVVCLVFFLSLEKHEMSSTFQFIPLLPVLPFSLQETYP